MNGQTFDPGGRPHHAPPRSRIIEELKEWLGLLLPFAGCLAIAAGGLLAFRMWTTPPPQPVLLPDTASAASTPATIPFITPAPPMTSFDPRTPLAVYVLTPEPTATATPIPATATYEAQMERARDAARTATAAAAPKLCSLSQRGELCVGDWPPTPTPIPLPTAGPCLATPIPDALCYKP